MTPKPIFDEELLYEFLSRVGAKSMHANVIWKQLLDHAGDFASLKGLPNFPERILPQLEHEFTYCSSKVKCLQQSRLDGTIKLLIELFDGKEIESVVINHTGEDMNNTVEQQGPRVDLRKTLCVSSQVGCKLGCTFCATGTMKLEANLSRGEIMEQLLLADDVLNCMRDIDAEETSPSCSTTDGDEPEASSNPDEIVLRRLHNNKKSSTGNKKFSHYCGRYISNVVFMGMGEPLENYDNVVAALKGLTSQQRFGLAQRNCTVSTVGIVPKMKQIFEDLPNIKLALSLHAPNQELRKVIVPVARKYPLPELMEALDDYSKRHATDGKRKGMVMVSYIMIDGVNDSPKHAKELVELLKNRQVLVNLIPFNSFDPYANNVSSSDVKPRQHPAEFYRPSEAEAIQSFLDTLTTNGIRAYERRPHGRDIAAACGQLAKIKKANDESVFEDLEDLLGGTSMMGPPSKTGNGGKLMITNGGTADKLVRHINRVVPLSREVVRKNEEVRRRRRRIKWTLTAGVCASFFGMIAIGYMMKSKRPGN